MTLDIPKRKPGRPKKISDCTQQIKDAILEWEGEREFDLLERTILTSKEYPEKEQDALGEHRKFAEILFIYVATIFMIVVSFYVLFRWFR